MLFSHTRPKSHVTETQEPLFDPLWGDAAMDVRENIGRLHLHDEFRASSPAATAVLLGCLTDLGS